MRQLIELSRSPARIWRPVPYTQGPRIAPEFLHAMNQNEGGAVKTRSKNTVSQKIVSLTVQLFALSQGMGIYSRSNITIKECHAHPFAARLLLGGITTLPISPNQSEA